MYETQLILQQWENHLYFNLKQPKFISKSFNYFFKIKGSFLGVFLINVFVCTLNYIQFN